MRRHTPMRSLRKPLTRAAILASLVPGLALSGCSEPPPPAPPAPPPAPPAAVAPVTEAIVTESAAESAEAPAATAPPAQSAQPAAAQSVEGLIAAVSTGAVADREDAINAIADLGPAGAAAIDALLKAARDENASVRWHAVRAIGLVGDNAVAAIPALVSLLKDADPLVVTQAAHAIGVIRREDDREEIPAADAATYAAAVDPLVEVTLHADPRVRRAAIMAMKTVATPGELLPLVSRHLEDADPTVVLPALHTLADLGQQAAPFLIEALGDAESRYWATVALAEMGPQAAAAVPQLMKLAAEAELPERMQAIYALAAIGEQAAEAVPALAAALDGNESLLRFAAAYALGRIRAAGADEALAKAAADDDGFLAEIAAWARARINPDDEPLVKVALERLEAGLTAELPAHRAASVTGLSDMAPSLDAARQAELAKRFANSLADADETVSMRAGAALVRLGAGSVDVLDGMLREASTRLPALEILAAIGAPAAAALPAVVPLLEDPEPAVRSEAAFTLAALSDKAADAVPKLVPLLADGQPPEVRYTTAYALGRIGAAAAPAFERLVALSKSNDDLMATVAVWAALKIRPDDTDLFKEAVPLLQGALDSPRQLARLEAAVSLGELGEAATAVLPALELVADNDPVEAVRDAATAAIRRIRGR